MAADADIDVEHDPDWRPPMDGVVTLPDEGDARRSERCGADGRRPARSRGSVGRRGSPFARRDARAADGRRAGSGHRDDRDAAAGEAGVRRCARRRPACASRQARALVRPARTSRTVAAARRRQPRRIRRARCVPAARRSQRSGLARADRVVPQAGRRDRIEPSRRVQRRGRRRTRRSARKRWIGCAPSSTCRSA